MPPPTWFGGIDFALATEMASELREQGAEVFEVDINCFVTNNELSVAHILEALLSFRPDLAISLPNAGYGLLCATPAHEHVFRDILQIPMVMLWDHGLFQFPKLVLDPLPRSPIDARPGSLKRLKEALDHPLFVHYSPDRSHIDALDRLGIIGRENVRFFLQPAYPNFMRYAYRTPPSSAFRTRIAFAGNVYLEARRKLEFRHWPTLAGIEARVLAMKQEKLTDSLWDLMQSELSRIAARDRQELRLDPDSSFFWSFVHDEIEVVGNTDVRLAILTGLRRSCDFFGNFIEPAAVPSLREEFGVKFRKSLGYFNELPLLFMNSDLIVDVINLGYNSGISPKVMGRMACGGIALFDYKEDFRREMGDVANEVMYHSIDHMNDLIDEYLSNPRKRRDAARYLQHRVTSEFSFGALIQRILIYEPVWRC
jgi:hypothetical protein